MRLRKSNYGGPGFLAVDYFRCYGGGFIMRYLGMLIGVILISSCSQGVGSVPPSGISAIPSTHRAGTGPSITKVSKIKAEQYQKIVISGSGFGTMKPYDGDSDYLQILDTTGGWSAGLLNSTQDDTVTLDVSSWDDNKIVITGFTGGYGESNWTLKKDDHLKINVWNAQTHNGPGTADKKVK